MLPSLRRCFLSVWRETLLGRVDDEGGLRLKTMTSMASAQRKVWIAGENLGTD